MLTGARPIAFAATADAERARAFYAGTLKLPLIADEPFALVFDCGGTQLRIQKVQQVQPAPQTVLGWEVPDISGVVRALGAAGVAFERYSFLPQDDLGVWTAGDGTKVAWFKDPDGNLLSLTQFPAGHP